MQEVLLALRDGTLTKEGVLPALQAAADGGGFSRRDLPGPCSDEELARIIGESARELSCLRLRHPRNTHRLLMGLVMDRVRGRVDGRMVAARLATAVPEVAS
jgi:Glu-tRNA(Gln) amidotransferase subunit E-like FAD-binding protein